jgi:hypothetical protein
VPYVIVGEQFHLILTLYLITVNVTNIKYHYNLLCSIINYNKNYIAGILTIARSS